MNMWKTLNKGIMKAFGMNIETDTATLNDESFLEWVGIKRDSESKKPTSDVTYFTCLKMMSETVAKMPWKLYQKTNKGISEPIDNDIARLMKQRPNPFMTPTTFWNAVEMNRNHYGNAYVYVRRKFKRKKYGGEYKALDMWIMPSDRVQIIVDDKGIFAGKGKIWYLYSDEYSGEQYIFRTEDVLHFKTSHCLNGIVGLPVQYILKQTVEGVIESQRFLNNLYKNGLTAKAVLEYTGELNEDAATKLRQTFERFGAGSQNTGKILPVPLGMKLTPLDIKLTDSQFVELKKYSALQIAAAFGIKPNQINDYEKSSYSNSEMQQLSFYVDTMLFVLKQYEEEVNYKLLSDMYMPMYGGSYDGAKLRSLSGKKLDCNTNAQTEISRAAANGTGWTIISWSRRNLIESLLTLISKSENFQAKFGQGVCSTYVNDSSKDYGKVVTGTLDTKGQFFGYNDGTHEVKAFYCEKLWGNRWDRLVGYICDNGTIKVKMSPPYNLTGKDYIKVGTACKTEGWQKDTLMTRYGRFIKSVGGSASTYRCCYYWINMAILAVALVGGSTSDGANCGAYVYLSSTASSAVWYIGGSPSCEEPLAA